MTQIAAVGKPYYKTNHTGCPRKNGATLQKQKLGTSYSETTHLLSVEIWQQSVLMSTPCSQSLRPNRCLVSEYEGPNFLLIFASIHPKNLFRLYLIRRGFLFEKSWKKFFFKFFTPYDLFCDFYGISDLRDGERQKYAVDINCPSLAPVTFFLQQPSTKMTGKWSTIYREYRT